MGEGKYPEDKEKLLITDLSSLELERGDLEEIRRAMAERIRKGLSSGTGEIATLPAFLCPPRPKEAGPALVIDIGGTNLRAAAVEISPEGAGRLARKPALRPLDLEWDSTEDFFDCQAELALSLGPPDGLPLGYCFSYPSRALPDGDAVLLQWHKELRVPGVIGNKVGKLLRESLARKGYTSPRVRVLNDTVAALIGGDLAYRRGGEFTAFIGLVVGTGTNLAAYFPAHLLGERIPEELRGMDPMAVNLESGNFHPPHLSPFDDELDAGREDAGRQRLEKAVSGRFLPQLFSYILEGRREPPFPAARAIFELAGDHRSPRGETARLIVNRSADLVAASLAGLIDTLETDGRIGILAEGGLIRHNPDYRKRLAGRLAELLGDDPVRPDRFKLLQLKNNNLIGAAAAVLQL